MFSLDSSTPVKAKKRKPDRSLIVADIMDWASTRAEVDNNTIFSPRNQRTSLSSTPEEYKYPLPTLPTKYFEDRKLNISFRSESSSNRRIRFNDSAFHEVFSDAIVGENNKIDDYFSSIAEEELSIDSTSTTRYYEDQKIKNFSQLESSLYELNSVISSLHQKSSEVEKNSSKNSSIIDLVKSEDVKCMIRSEKANHLSPNIKRILKKFNLSSSRADLSSGGFYLPPFDFDVESLGLSHSSSFDSLITEKRPTVDKILRFLRNDGVKKSPGFLQLADIGENEEKRYEKLGKNKPKKLRKWHSQPILTK